MPFVIKHTILYAAYTVWNVHYLANFNFFINAIDKCVEPYITELSFERHDITHKDFHLKKSGLWRQALIKIM